MPRVRKQDLHVSEQVSKRRMLSVQLRDGFGRVDNRRPR